MNNPLTHSPHWQQALTVARQLNATERRLLATYLLNSILNDEELAADEADWQALSLSRFAAEWDNPEDAIYDNWREHYDVPTR